MRIVHLTKYLPPFRGGIELAVEELSLAGKTLGAEVEVFGVAKESHGGGADGILYQPVRCRFHVGPAPIATGFWQLFDHLLSSDVVHVHMPNPMAEVTMLELARRRGRRKLPKLVSMPHAPILRWAGLGRRWQEWIEKPVLKLSDRVLFASPQMLATFMSNPAQRHKTRLLPYPMRAYHGPIAISRARSIELCALGRHVRYKGFDVLLRALPGVRGDWRLRLAGKGPETANLRRQASLLGLEGRVEFLEQVSEAEKHSLIASSDIVVVPSRTNAEAFGLVIAEAFTHAKPVVLTRLPTGVAFLARSGACGAAVEPDSERELTAAIQQLIDDPERRRAAGQANYEFWRRELSVSIFESRYREIIQQLVAGSRH